MAELTQLLRWNTNFVRGLAQTVLERAKSIRNSLPASAAATLPPTPKKAATRKSPATKATKVITAKKIKASGRKPTKSKKANV